MHHSFASASASAATAADWNSFNPLQSIPSTPSRANPPVRPKRRSKCGFHGLCRFYPRNTPSSNGRKYSHRTIQPQSSWSSPLCGSYLTIKRLTSNRLYADASTHRDFLPLAAHTFHIPRTRVMRRLGNLGRKAHSSPNFRSDTLTQFIHESLKHRKTRMLCSVQCSAVQCSVSDGTTTTTVAPLLLFSLHLGSVLFTTSSSPVAAEIT